MKARVTVTLKSGILDPQGKAIEGALKSLGVDGVASVRQGKVFDVEIDGHHTTEDVGKSISDLYAAVGDPKFAKEAIRLAETIKHELAQFASNLNDPSRKALLNEAGEAIPRANSSLSKRSSKDSAFAFRPLDAT